MGKYFGTDGIRGVAGSELTCDIAFRMGVASAYIIGKDALRQPLFAIGRDTRLSGDMISAALTAGLTAAGADVIDLGIIPTPAVAHFTSQNDFVDSGVVISASHNPFEHNGIKFFGGKGYKLTDKQEEEIEYYIDNIQEVPLKTGKDIGKKRVLDIDPVRQYAQHVADSAERLDGMRLLIDCANGASYKTAKIIFSLLGAQADFIACQPNGVNINDECGSTHLDKLCAAVKAGNYDAGLAFDGDADRFLMTDENGVEIDGDRIIGVLAAYMQQQEKLRGGAVVTVMSNLGLHEFLHSRGIETHVTKVGDRYVLEEMLASGCNIGGEQSGHVILTDYCTTGDGEMTAVQVLSMLRKTGMKASAILDLIASFPQVMINIEVKNEIKKTIGERPEVLAVGKEISDMFSGSGRVLIRPSGTEAKVRVMVEGKERDKVEQMAQKAADVIKALAQNL